MIIGIETFIKKGLAKDLYGGKFGDHYITLSDKIKGEVVQYDDDTGVAVIMFDKEIEQKEFEDKWGCEVIRLIKTSLPLKICN